MNRSQVLIVDDEDVVRRSYAAALDVADCETQMACGGPEALRAMEHDDFDVVLLDLRMPDCDGLAVLATMKRLWPQREVVIITGYPSVESAKEAVRLGASDYLAKPVGPDEIVGVTRAAVTRKHWAMRDPLTRSIP
jgi:DNA-binding NtrC family response regulator